MVNRLAQRLNLPSQDIDEITLAARVHDLGKIGIANEILLKEGKLNAEEMAVMRAHPEIGVSILHKYDSFEATLPMVMHHHERYDGRGYPRGISGNEIPMGSRLIAVVDAYDAMTSDRPYRKGMRSLLAVQRVAEATGTQFDPAVAAAFVAMMYEDLAARGEPVPNIGGSLGHEPELIAAGAEDKVRYLRPNSAQ
jgi:HD-GYP domain-containing protein (c-di-GMP phosphodiesterase class II)